MTWTGVQGWKLHERVGCRSWIPRKTLPTWTKWESTVLGLYGLLNTGVGCLGERIDFWLSIPHTLWLGYLSPSLLRLRLNVRSRGGGVCPSPTSGRNVIKQTYSRMGMNWRRGREGSKRILVEELSRRVYVCLGEEPQTKTPKTGFCRRFVWLNMSGRPVEVTVSGCILFC